MDDLTWLDQLNIWPNWPDNRQLTYNMGNNDTYKLSENPALNYNAWEFRICISAQLNVLLKTFWDNAQTNNWQDLEGLEVKE